MYTIEDLRLGKCAVINDGSDEFKEVLSKAFPNYHRFPEGFYPFYLMDIDAPREFYYTHTTNLPAVTPKALVESTWKPKFNEKVLIPTDTGWVERYFVATDSRGKHIVSVTGNGAFSAAGTGFVDTIKERVIVSVTMEEIASWKGCDVNLLEIKTNR